MASTRDPVLGVITYREQARAGIWDVPAGFLAAARDYAAHR